MNRAPCRAVPALLALCALAACQRTQAPAGLVVAGGDGGGLPRATAVAEGFDAAALGAARALAEGQGASALLVARHGHLVLEWRAHGDGTALVGGGTMGELALALLAGNAAAQAGRAPPATAAELQSLVPLMASAAGGDLGAYLSRELWQPLNASPARLAGDAGANARGCCLEARDTDWLRLAQVLLDAGRFEGTQVAAAPWVAAMRQPVAGDPTRALGSWRAPAAAGAEPFATDGVLFVRGPGRTRLYMMPAASLAILQVGEGELADETRVPNAIMRALLDAQPGRSSRGLGDLVPGH